MKKATSWRRIPLAYSAKELANWTVEEEYEPGKWRPARQCALLSPLFGLGDLRRRFKMAWSVFTGRNDVVYWGENSGQWSNDHIAYRDILDKNSTLRHEHKGP